MKKKIMIDGTGIWLPIDYNSAQSYCLVYEQAVENGANALINKYNGYKRPSDAKKEAWDRCCVYAARRFGVRRQDMYMLWSNGWFFACACEIKMCPDDEKKFLLVFTANHRYIVDITKYRADRQEFDKIMNLLIYKR